MTLVVNIRVLKLTVTSIGTIASSSKRVTHIFVSVPFCIMFEVAMIFTSVSTETLIIVQLYVHFIVHCCIHNSINFILTNVFTVVLLIGEDTGIALTILDVRNRYL